MFGGINVGDNPGTPASAQITCTSLPAVGDTVTINGTTFTFGTDFTGEATPVLNGPQFFTDRDQAAVMSNFAKAINSRNGLGFAAFNIGPDLYVVAQGIGTAANSWVLSKTGTAFTVPSTFSGGS
jgi:hypothetical protein